jgi:hypothetical protein
MNMFSRLLAGVTMIALCSAVTAQENAGGMTVSFSDPSRPGVLHVRLVTGSITVRGGDVKDVIIESHARSGGPGPPRPAETASLRELPQGVSISVEEQNNRMEVSSRQMNRPIHLDIQVPARTHLDLATVNGGDIHVEGVDGELEVGNVNGSITLDSVSGSVVAHTVNGKVLATLSRVAPQKPMAFTSLNGVVDVTLPAATKANLKLRTDNGRVFTDFDLSILPQASAPVVEDTRRSGGRYRIESNKVIAGGVNGGGPDIEMRTFNGDIIVRKGAEKTASRAGSGG